MMDKINYIFFKIFKFIIRLLPDRVSYYLAMVLGGVLYYFITERRELAVENIKKSLDYDTTEAKRLTKEVFQDIALKFVEILKLEDWNLEQLNDRIEIEGEEHLKKLKDSEQGVVLFTGHFGNWELLGVYLSALNYPITAIARDHRNQYIYDEIIKIRKSQGADIFNRSQIKKALKALFKQKFLLILGDQDAHQAGEFVEFFGRPASTPVGPVRLAQRSNSAIVPVYLAREGFNQYRLIVNEAIEINKDATAKEQRKVLQHLTTSLENIIRDYPAQWLWLHRRWKTKVEECSQ